jgi:membrane protein YdbS with pleckstrin-like domain
MNDIFVAPKHNKTIKKPTLSPHASIPVPNYSEDVGILSTFCRNPKGISFQTQKQHETIILFLRSHFITNISWIIISIILIILPIVFMLISPSFGLDFLSSPPASRFITIYILLYYLLISSYMFVSFLHWFYNVFIVTSERVVDIDYSDIVIHNIAVTSLSSVQDVHYTQSGFIPASFNYGHLFVQTAGSENNFEAYSIPRPREAVHIIGNLSGKK